jgi:hypothetical protein
MKSLHPQIRDLLRKNNDGLTIAQLTVQLRLVAKDVRPNSIQTSVSTMPDSYIDRWEGPNQGQYAAVWCVVVPPENCPKPSRVNAST